MSASSSRSTNILNAGTTLVFNGAGLLNGVQLNTDGTNAATVTIYDNIVGSGLVLAQFSVPGATLSGSRNFIPQIKCEIGITVVVSGTGAPTAIVLWGGKVG